MEHSNQNNVSAQPSDVVQLEINLAKLEELFRLGVICAADIRSLNSESKQSVWKLCLSACAKRMLCTPIVVHAETHLNTQVESIAVRDYSQG